MAKKITIIGAGPGGYVAAVRAAQIGAEVTLIERDNVGGTCLNRGCIPSKIMIHTAEMLEKFHRAQEFGITVEGNIRPDMHALMSRKEKVIQTQIKGILSLLQHHKIRVLKGQGFIESPNLAAVRQENGETVQVAWDKLILAPGTQPLNIPTFPFDGKRILSSNDALNLREVPKSIVIVGGGVIGCEFAFMLNALGSGVTVIEAMSRMLPLPSVDEDCSKVLQREMKKRKIAFMTDRIVQRVEKSEERLIVTVGPSPFLKNPTEKDKLPLNIETEKVLVCIGRQPDTAGLGLENIGIKLDEKGWIVANECMETGVPDMYAVGDILGPAKIMLAHVASAEGMVAAENAMGNAEKMNYDAIPGAIFTMPEVANVGLTEIQAKEKGFSVRADSVLFRMLGKAQAIGDIAGEAKIVSDAETGKILGVHIVGPHATDLIAEGTLAVKSGCTVKELAETVHAHPTLAEIMLEVSLKSAGKALHG